MGVMRRDVSDPRPSHSSVYQGGSTQGRLKGPSKPADTSYGQATVWNSILRPSALATFMIVAKLGLPSVESAL